MDKIENNNTKKITAIINDIFDKITEANYDENYIDFDGKII